MVGEILSHYSFDVHAGVEHRLQFLLQPLHEQLFVSTAVALGDVLELLLDCEGCVLQLALLVLSGNSPCKSSGRPQSALRWEYSQGPRRCRVPGPPRFLPSNSVFGISFRSRNLELDRRCWLRRVSSSCASSCSSCWMV